MIHLGYEKPTGDSIDIPITHLVATGQTRYGKSETIRALAPQAAEQGYKVLLFDVKRGRDYADTGTDIPVYLEESTDPRTLKGLLEADEDISVNVDFSEMIEVCERGDDYESVLQTARDMEDDDDTHPVDEKKLRVIRFLLEEMIEDMESVEISDTLDLNDGVNVMDLHDVAGSVQQVAIAASCKYVLDNYDDVIVVIDEAHNFMPQSGKPPANEPIARIMREGAQMGVYGWLVDQTITGIDKDPLKQVDVWLIGRQREKNEAKRARDQIPSGEYSTNDLMNLTTGEFVVALDDSTPLVYVQPHWMDDDTAREIAIGDIDMDDIHEPKPDPSETEPETDESDLETALERKDDRIAELEATIERMNEELDAMQSDDTVEMGEWPTGDLDDRLDEKLTDLIESYEVPESVTVTKTQSKLIVRREIEPIEVSVNESDPIGVVAYLYATGEIPVNKGLFPGDVEDIASEHGYSITLKRTGILNEFCKMGIMEKSANNSYAFTVGPQEAESRGLLEVDEAIS